MPISDHTALLQETIEDSIGANVKIEVDVSGRRQGLILWFADLTSNEGPVFELIPLGLKQHKVTLQFGAYARECVERINRADKESYSVARALIGQVSQYHKVDIYPNQSNDSWTVDKDFRITVIIKGLAHQFDDDAIKETTSQVIVPLMAAMAELIGYEIVDPELSGNEEGRVSEVTIIKRERNKRNRLLCLAVHGKKCAVCGLDPLTLYPESIGEILEVHHIEPLSDLDRPRTYDPRTDLIPLCPNCHRAIHEKEPVPLPGQLKQMLKIK